MPHSICPACLQPDAGLSICANCGWSMETSTTDPLYLVPGTKVNPPYQVARVLGHGGFGITYLGWDANLQIKVAIKEYLPREFAHRDFGTGQVIANSADAQAQFQAGLNSFLDEARTLAKFQQHPGIVSVLSFFPAFGTGYMVMEYVEGQTLKNYLQRHDRLEWTQTLDIFMQIMDALRAVHKVGLLHRDIAPDNIYLCGDGRVKLLDFGAALLGHVSSTQSSPSLTVMVKPGFAPEEQYRNSREQGPWSDVYSVAASMYFCLTGRTPPDAVERLKQDLLKPPSVCGAFIPSEAEQVLLSALAVNSLQRPQSIETLQQQFLSLQSRPSVVQGALMTQATKASQTSAFPYPAEQETPRKFSWQRWVQMISALLILLMFIFQLAKHQQRQSESTAPATDNGQRLQTNTPDPVIHSNTPDPVIHSNTPDPVIHYDVDSDNSRQRELERQAAAELKQRQEAALKRFEERQHQAVPKISKPADARQSEHLRSLCDEWGATMGCKDTQ